MLELLFSALICVVEYSIHFMFLHHYLKDRWGKSFTILISKIVAVITCAITLTFINTFQNSLWNVLTVFTLTFLLAYIFFKGKWLIKVFLAAVASTLSIISEFITMVLFSAIFGENLTIIVTLPTAHIPMTIISKVLLFTLVRVIFLFKKGTKYTKMGKESLLLYALPIVTVANITLMVQLEYYVPAKDSHKVLMAFVCIGLIFCNIAVFFIYDKNLKKYELENQLRQAQEMQRLQANYYMQLEKSLAVFFIYDRNLRKYELENQLREAEEMQRIQASYYKQIEKGLNESRKQLHDFKNHITTLERLYHTDSKDKALNYMHELQAQMSQQMAAASFRVNNTAFDVILYEQEKTCKEQGIIFEKQILYNDLSILKYIDTCTIFANALDNAVKACSEIQNGEKKITLEVKRTNDILSIIIENTKQNHVVCENEKFVSSKADKHNHGFGVENIKMAVEKYNGIVSIDYTDTIFTLAISIPLLNEQK